MAKYEFTGETKFEMGVTLKHIRALHAFSHIAEGEVGGWIESEKNLSQDGNAWVSDNARVFGNGRVSDNAWVSSDARVSDNARVFGDAWVSSDARVSDNARVSGNAWVFGDAGVFGDAWVVGHARVSGNAWVFGDALLSGNVRLSCNARVYSTPIFASRSDGYTFICTLDAGGHAVISAGCRYFTFPQAIAHWTTLRAGTPLGEETDLLITFLAGMAKVRGWRIEP